MLRRLTASLLIACGRACLPAPRRRSTSLLAPIAPDEALLRVIAVLRALGARITRYDGVEGSLEACLARWRGSGTVRVRATARPDGSLLCVESDAPGWSATRQLLERELTSVKERGQ